MHLFSHLSCTAKQPTEKHAICVPWPIQTRAGASNRSLAESAVVLMYTQAIVAGRYALSTDATNAHNVRIVALLRTSLQTSTQQHDLAQINDMSFACCENTHAKHASAPTSRHLLTPEPAGHHLFLQQHHATQIHASAQVNTGPQGDVTSAATAAASKNLAPPATANCMLILVDPRTYQISCQQHVVCSDCLE